MENNYKSIVIGSGIQSVIVEDEVRSQATLNKLLKEYCPQVKVVGTAGSVEEAIKTIDELKPQLIFLDIALPDGDGFNVLENITHDDYRVIFVTAYDKYAIRAFEFSALHYLLKPISHIELQIAVKRYWKQKDDEEIDYKSKITTLKENINSDQQKILLPTSQGYEVISLDDIIRLEASHNYTECFLVDNQKILISRSLINFETILNDLQFVRIHNKHLINLKFVKKYIRGSGGSVKMSDESEINVSKSRKTEFLEKLAEYARQL